MGHKDILDVQSDPTLQTGEVQRGLSASFLPGWQTVCRGPEPETAQSERLTKFLCMSFSFISSEKNTDLFLLLLNVGYAGALCEHAEFCLYIQWPRRMWKQEIGDPFQIHKVHFK